MGVSGQCHAPAVLYPWGKDPRYPMDRSWAGWTPEPVWTQGLEEKSSVPVGVNCNSCTNMVDTHILQDSVLIQKEIINCQLKYVLQEIFAEFQVHNISTTVTTKHYCDNYLKDAICLARQNCKRLLPVGWEMGKQSLQKNFVKASE
jgi:hypothetical protein